MAEGTYEYECMRAELLGIEQPDYEEFMKKKQEREAAAEEDADTENLKEVEYEADGVQRISGGLDEINSILQVTQRKINRFKASCGSLTNLLKIKIGHGSTDSLEASTSASASTTTTTNNETEEGEGEGIPQPTTNGTASSGPRKSDLARALDNHVDSLDSLIDKAENAQYSMSHQTKEMRRFLNN